MPRPKGHPKTGGRKAGTPNKVTAAIGVTLDDLFGPGAIEAWKQVRAIALDPHSDVNARLKACAMPIPYQCGKPPDTVRLEGTDGGPLTVVHKHVDVKSA